MKNSKIIDLYNGLVNLTNLKGVKFNYAVAKNINILEKEADLLKSTLKETDEYKKYDAERIELCEKSAKKHENGEPILINGQYIMEDMAAFNVELEALKEMHKEALDARKIQVADFEKLLEVENPIELFKINISEIPEDVTTSQMNVLYPIIVE